MTMGSIAKKIPPLKIGLPRWNVKKKIGWNPKNMVCNTKKITEEST